MSSKRFLRRIPTAKIISVATLLNHQLKFHKIGSIDGSGKCDAFETGNADHSIIGVVYEITDSEKHILDRIEGLHHGYEQKTVKVTTSDNRTLQAFTYFATRINRSLKPFDWYKQHVITGAIENFFSPEYIRNLSSIESINDPVQDRQQEELSIY